MRNDIKILDEEEIKEELTKVKGWRREGNKISKEISFESFMGALSFILRMSCFFEKNDHHPDMHISYKKVKFELQRYDVGGKLTDLDFKTAKEIDRVHDAFI